MSKELELFRQIVKGYTEMFNMAIHHPKDTFVKWEGVEEIENVLKALEIIKEKKVNLEYLKCCDNYEQYKLVCSYWNEITEDEFDLLKEVLL